ncbi:non-homologous end joining protein Ku [Streptomyces sp. V1I1]|nr:non-homologous end joining protein Ku [Streptomyces sp. V1I1]
MRNKRVNERTGKEVSLDQIVKGFDAGEEYVLVEPGELDDIAPGRSQALEIIGFVDWNRLSRSSSTRRTTSARKARSTPGSTPCWSRH